MFLKDLGEPVTGRFPVPGGDAQVHERGITLFSTLGESTVTFDFPALGVPAIATGDAATAAVLAPSAISFQIGGHQLDAFVAMVRAAFDARVALLPTARPPAPVALTLGAPAVVRGAASGVQSTHGLPATAPLQERTLYDISVRRDDGSWKAIAPHAVYFRSSWTDFGIAHATDLHVARRIEFFRPRLDAAGRHDAAQHMVNFNDRFRGFVRYANYLHDQGLLDVILATGDILDYLYEDDDDEGGGNAEFMRSLILGQWPGPDFQDVEELRVPMFMVPGNHDYRKHPYALVATIDFYGHDAHPLSQYGGYALTEADAVIAQGQEAGDAVPTRRPETLARSLAIDREITAYKTHLADRLDYVVSLGPHRIVMLDSGPDIELPESREELIQFKLGRLAEGKTVAIDGSPNQRGVSGDQIEDVVATMAGMPAEGLLILGMHAPLFNMWREEYPYFFRESLRPSQEAHATNWVARHSTVRSDPSGDARNQHPSFFREDGGSPTYVKRGVPDELLDFGVAKGAAHDLLKVLAGIKQSRRADLVLHGHIHSYNEFRLGVVNDEVAYYTDFYTGGLSKYYPTRLVTGWDGRNQPFRPTTEAAHVEFATDAPANNQPSAVPVDSAFNSVVAVPPYATPLSSAPDPAVWWAHHRPLVLQSEALGPVKNRLTNLNGFRLITVRNNVIQRIDLASMETLHAANYRIDWSDVIRPDPLRTHVHAQRSREFTEASAGFDPCGFALGGDDIVYVDEQGQLFELWRDPQGKRGIGALTAAIGGGDRAGGHVSCFVDAAAGKVVVLYRGKADGHVHSLYWTRSGTPGHDSLSRTAGAPPCDSTPVGFYNPSNGTTHVIYRGGDRLHSLSWQGAGGITYENLTTGVDAPPAEGHPAAYLDSTTNTNVVVYRSADNHIRSIAWSEGPSHLDDLSGVARGPYALSDPCGYYIASQSLNQVYYRGDDNHVYELWWRGTDRVSLHDVTAAAAGAPTASGDPHAWFNAAGNRKHIAYLGTDGHLHLLQWTPGGAVAHVDLTLESWCVPPHGRLYGFSGASHQHLVYRGTDRRIHEIRWTEPIVGLPDVVFLNRPGGGVMVLR
jgi:hypothetical protein